MLRIALLSTPWPLFNRPSVQLGALKAFLRQGLPSLKVDAHHVYLSIAAALGYDLYKAISEKTWLSEAPFAALLYPEKRHDLARFWQRQSSTDPLLHQSDFEDVLNRLGTISDRILSETKWQEYGLIGYSICFGQLTSSLYFVHQIKQRAPSVPIVVGGSACSGELGRSLLDAFSEIDFVIDGEGELPLLHLVKWLMASGGSGYPQPVPGLLGHKMERESGEKEFSQVHDLDQLPFPDYHDYFSHLKSLNPDHLFMPKLPMEISRGCWWVKRIQGGPHRGCAFCNLNLQWQGYRSKSQERVISELDTLTQEYELLSVSFTDNLLPAGNLEELFRKVAQLGKDLRLFGEIRATTSWEELAAMAAAGVREVQVGIEGLSTRLLKKLNKGTTAMNNLEMMKNCEVPGSPKLTGNLILNFPGSDRADVQETLATLEFAFPFRPVKGIPFWLGYSSPVWRDPEAYGIKGLRNHPYYSYLFPPEILGKLSLIIQAYHGGLRHQRRLWLPVKQKIEEWKTSYTRLHQTPASEPILSYQDGGNFLIIRERRSGDNDMTHKLKGSSRGIYLFCERSRTLTQILENFPGLGEEKVRPFLKMMVQKRLFFEEGERYLSLAVPIRGFKG
jgi:ribosomal peptide maturation radical SAM protein 1